jgi:streptomycin 6-kinase
MEIPDGLATDIERIEGRAGRTWIESLPVLVAETCARWDLEIEGAPRHGARGLVVLVRRGPEPLALKIAWPDDLTRAEYRAIPLWDGRGVVRLVDAVPESGIALMERLDSTRPLSSLPLDAAVAVAGDLIRTTAIPTNAVLPMMAGRAAAIAGTLRTRWESCNRPMPERRIDDAIDIAREAEQRPTRLLVNWDLHSDNVLAGERLPWIVVDPHPVIGDPELALAPLLWTRCDEIEGPARLRRLFTELCDHAALDPDLAERLLRFRLVDYWLWGLGVGLTIDPERCRTLLDWLDRG